MDHEMLKETMDTLGVLIQWDIDDANAYEQAISNLEDAAIQRKFEIFKSDHKRHIREISALIIEMGGILPKNSTDFKGYLISGYTAIRSKMGTKGALEAMQTNEKMTIKRYEESLEKNLTPRARLLISANLEDERNHLNFIEATLSLKSS